MDFRTDLIREMRDNFDRSEGVKQNSFVSFGIHGFSVKVETDQAERELQKKKGTYITLEAAGIRSRDPSSYLDISRALAAAIRLLLPTLEKQDTVLVSGLGNQLMTPDSVGPKCVERLLVTRHLLRFMKEAADPRMQSVCAIAPGVLGVTGMESADILRGVCQTVNVKALLVIDALAARKSERMFSSFQLTDTGICPGAGVGNRRGALDRETLGIPVIALGVPTVVYASSLVYDAAFEACGHDKSIAEKISDFVDSQLVVTPKEIDVIARDAALVISDAVNMALHPEMTREEINEYLF